MKVVPSTYHQIVSYLTSTGQVDLLSSQLAARQCYQLSTREQKEEKGSGGLPLRDHIPAYQLQLVAQVRAEEKDPLVVDPLETLALDEPKKFTYVSTLLSNEEKEQLRCVLLGIVDVFAWSHSDMAGIDPTLAAHKLNVIAMAKPVRQKIRRFHLDRHQIIQTKVDNLLSAGFIIEAKYPEWHANVVVFSKKGGKWKVCMDYTDLNEACPKDSFCHARRIPVPLDWRIRTEVRGAILSILYTIYYNVLGLSLTYSFSELYLYLWVYKQFL